MSLKITRGDATPSSISLVFSDAIVADNTKPPSSTNIGSYTVTLVGGANLTVLTAYYEHLLHAVILTLKGQTVAGKTTPPMKVGDFVSVTATVAVASDPANPIPLPLFVVRVNGESEVKEATRAVEEAVAYPVLTEQVNFSQGGGLQSTGGGYSSPQGSASLGLVASNALSDVLGWKINSTDSRGFVGALTQSFSLAQVEGHVEATYTPRSYTVQTDLSQGITGAQASLYTRAKDALDKCLPLLDGLYPLDPETEMEDAEALRGLARSQMTEIVNELGQVGGPSTLRIDTYFDILLGVGSPATRVPKDADDLTGGTLKDLRDVFGIGFVGNPFSNTVKDEEDITNFRTIVDYLTSLLQTWINNRQFFNPAGKDAFFGTTLVLMSRQFSVVVETVNEVRFAMNSVFIGPAERQTLLLEFSDSSQLQPMFLEDILGEIDRFASDEGPRLIQDGGRLAVQNNVVPVVKTLQRLVSQTRTPKNIRALPDGFRTVRVKNTLDDLHDQLKELVRLAKPVERTLPPPEGAVFANPGKLDFTGDNPTEQLLTIMNLNSTGKVLSMAVVDQHGLTVPSGTFTFAPQPLLINAQNMGVATITYNSPLATGTYTLRILSAEGVVLQTVSVTV